MRTNPKVPRRTGSPGPPGGRTSLIFGPKPRGGPCADLPRSYGITVSSQNRHPTIFVNHFDIGSRKPKEHENQTQREDLQIGIQREDLELAASAGRFGMGCLRVVKKSPPERREPPFASVLAKKSIGSLPSKHFPSFRW